MTYVGVGPSLKYYEVVHADHVDDAFPDVYRSHAWDIRSAAEEWARKQHAGGNYADEMFCIVTTPAGERWKVRVVVEAVPVFHCSPWKLE